MHTLEEGQRFERYRILHYLGEGISGESYEVEDIALQRKATLKLIHPWSTLTDAARRQFFRQMQVISLLTHTYLTTMLDYGEVDGQLYIVRQYTGYGSLLGPAGRAWFNPPLGEAEAIRYTYQLAQALHKIHKYRYVHGALSLSNILVVSAPPAEKARATASPFLLTDVGLGHFVRRYGHPRITHLPATAAPEQMELRLLPASDQYALAALLYFWLTGRHLFQGTSEEITQAKLSGSFIAPTELNSSITPAQEAILRRALSIAPRNAIPPSSHLPRNWQ
ncbi:hypothetical protein EPA93_20335 [Ktedonosporobacter rubrisoli]|uniref:non-specific serine/threonine protein kinase n=1 Tax=Ktedonosporobacter rubrisoli TaxID=2509675 RepID=A0A4P6JSJ7_KTERU|nr:protein kinase [Ktedonosporobacter rubrisoli]QBD78220.1 hypothetical protein EPA93_20335 [Ktedonosporobacter rubrisoli]